MRKILAKRNLLLTGLILGLVCLAACQEKPGTTVVPTDTPTPTTTPAPTESIVPSVEPTEVPTIEPTIAPTETVAPEPTIAPTEVPHEHTWVKKATFATCGEEGRSWEECECGEIQNEIITEKLPHKKCTYNVIIEPTVESEGYFETTCDECGTIVSSGSIPKHVHEWIPFVTPPTCTEDGKQWEECLCGEKQNELVLYATGHGETEKRTTKEPSVKSEGEYEEYCKVCGEVLKTGKIKKLTPTPTPTPSVTPKPTATPSPTPVPITPTPTPKVVDSYEFVFNDGHTEMVEEFEDGTSAWDTTDMHNEVYAIVVDEYLYAKEYYDSEGRHLYDEELYKDTRVLHSEKLGEITAIAYFYEYSTGTHDYPNSYSILVNPDGSFNQWSHIKMHENTSFGSIFAGWYIQETPKGSEYGYVVDSDGDAVGIKYITFSAGYDAELKVFPEDLVWLDEKTIVFYDPKYGK